MQWEETSKQYEYHMDWKIIFWFMSERSIDRKVQANVSKSDWTWVLNQIDIHVYAGISTSTYMVFTLSAPLYDPDQLQSCFFVSMNDVARVLQLKAHWEGCDKSAPKESMPYRSLPRCYIVPDDVYVRLNAERGELLNMLRPPSTDGNIGRQTIQLHDDSSCD